MAGAQPAAVTLAEVRRIDGDLLLSYMRALRTEDPFPTNSPADEAASRDAMSRLIDDPALGRAWLIRCDDRPAGYVVLTLGYSIEFGGRTAFVDELYVDPALRRRGVAREALRLVSEAAGGIGVRVLFLEVSATNESARRLYQSCGFADRKYQTMYKRLA